MRRLLRVPFTEIAAAPLARYYCAGDVMVIGDELDAELVEALEAAYILGGPLAAQALLVAQERTVFERTFVFV